MKKKYLVCVIFLFVAAAHFIFAQAVVDTKMMKNIMDAFDEEDAAFTDEASPYKQLKEILDSEDFGKKKEVWSLRFKEEKEGAEEYNFIKIADWIKFLRKISAYILRFFIVITVIALLILLIVIFKKIKKDRGKNFSVAFGGFFTDQKLSVVEMLDASIKLFEKGEERYAWSLCFSAILRAFENLQIIFPKNATEYECVELVKKSGKYQHKEFECVVKDRIRVSYANMRLPKDNFLAAADFCRSIINRVASGKDSK